MADIQTNTVPPIVIRMTQGYIGQSGYSGASGYGGTSGYSGYSGISYGLIYRGHWDTGIQYQVNDVVSFASYDFESGNMLIESYIALQPSIDVSPYDGEIWQLFAKGADGMTGATGFDGQSGWSGKSGYSGSATDRVAINQTTTPQTLVGKFTFPSIEVTNYLKYNDATKHVLVGLYAGQYLRSSSHDCTFLGYCAGNGIGTVSGSANYNTGVGSGALYATMTGDNNTAVGYGAMEWAQTGNDNTCIGSEAGNNISSGDQNTCIGSDTLHNIRGGDNNTGLGAQTLYSCNSGDNNVAVGYNALYHQLTSSAIGIGFEAGSYLVGGVTPNTTADGSIFIGNYTTSLSYDQNCIVIGNYARSWGTNSITIGNDSNTRCYLHGNVTIGTPYNNAGLTINDPTGNCMRLIYNNNLGLPTLYADFMITAQGDLSINATGTHISFGTNTLLTGAITMTGDMNITGSIISTSTSAPIQITPGILVDIPVSGYVESDGDHLYWTDSNGIRKQLD